MMIMPANNSSGYIHYWAGKNPGCVGHIHSPSNRRSFYKWIPVALDNDRYLCATQGRVWNESAFIEHWETAKWTCPNILWGVVPDVWGDRDQTIADWHKWEPRLRKYRIPLAFAVQDEMTPDDVPKSADVIFIGGSDEWRYPRLTQFLAIGKPVHVGRVNGNHIWQLHQLGVTSCDGSGWFRGDRKQLGKLDKYLQFLAGEISHPLNGQMSLLI